MLTRESMSDAYPKGVRCRDEEVDALRVLLLEREEGLQTPRQRPST